MKKNESNKKKKKQIPAIRHHQATEKRSYQYNKLYSTIDSHYAITLYFELVRAFLDLPPLSIVGPSGTQSTSSSLPPNTILIVLLVTKSHTLRSNWRRYKKKPSHSSSQDTSYS